MTVFMKIRGGVRAFFSANAFWIEKIFRAVIWLISALVIINFLGYAEMLNSPLIAAGFAAVLAFAPMSVGAFIFMIYILLQLLSLSPAITITALLFFVVCFLICGIYGSNRQEFFIVIPVTYQIGVPFLVPLFAGLFGKLSHAGSVACGAVLSWLLKSISENYALITDANQPNAVLELLSREMIMNPMFYIYVIASMAIFLTAYGIRSIAFEYAWQIAACAATVVEFIIMLAGYLFLDRREAISSLVISNIIILVAAAVLAFFVRDLDFNRTEKVRFEDDEYYYYVTAVPKIQFAAEKNEVKNITAETKKEKHSSGGHHREGASSSGKRHPS